MGKGSKVVVCGSAAVGKTAIIEQLLYGNYVVDILIIFGRLFHETLEDIYIASVETDRGVREQLRLYDTQGLQEGAELPKHYFSFADGFILVYSVDCMASFQRVKTLKREVDMFKDKKETMIIVLGNKTDLADQRKVDPEMTHQWAKSERVKLWDVSVTDRSTLIEPFTYLANKLNQIQTKSSFPLPGRKSKGAASDT
ncbi:NF-kappa-B inhibitor-interacting Ras 1 [Pelobates cultripes]|uniref:NF-kappa-B inhibitor-interacting Ras 1 n=1 Tax=Pelobates cultripes TaxID=61616 RepID=A0AAD1W487_PELCU|nr:NF-kappa-B inhibitor-interacting Ras 1 [Pelobates cultripes]